MQADTVNNGEEEEELDVQVKLDFMDSFLSQLYKARFHYIRTIPPFENETYQQFTETMINNLIYSAEPFAQLQENNSHILTIKATIREAVERVMLAEIRHQKR